MLLRRAEVDALLECVATELVVMPPSSLDRLKAMHPAVLLSPVLTEFESYLSVLSDEERVSHLEALAERQSEVLPILLMPLPRDVPQAMMVDLLLRLQAILLK